EDDVARHAELMREGAHEGVIGAEELAVVDPAGAVVVVGLGFIGADGVLRGSPDKSGRAQVRLLRIVDHEPAMPVAGGYGEWVGAVHLRIVEAAAEQVTTAFQRPYPADEGLWCGLKRVPKLPPRAA